MSNEKLEKIAIDSNVFRNLNFINYLRLNKAEIQVYIPSIVSFEIGYYFLNKGITWEDFLIEIQKFNGVFLEWDSVVLLDVIKNVIANKKTLPFRHHFRDFLIGTQCEKTGFNLISYNKNHFLWLKRISIQTPEEFILNRI
ncbi:MAG: type II toxin-antitoxin system VapC family toxin [Candidatus Lokiarchaeota archaeon]|nr:type II toxin-antitoxin system VapC family toxin [Candidatus Lokiarchaeota archaeon]